MSAYLKKGISLFVVCLAMSAVAWAEMKSARVTLPDDVSVKGTVVKKGSYRIEFNDQAGSLTFFNGKEAVASAPARTESRERKAKKTEINTVTKENQNILRSVVFAGDNQVIMLDGSGGQKTSGQQ